MVAARAMDFVKEKPYMGLKELQQELKKISFRGTIWSGF
jgi:hypothetical protein